MRPSIDIANISSKNIVAFSLKGAQNLSHTFDQLIEWATQNDLMNDNSKLGTMYYDSFGDTVPSQVRMSTFLVLEEPLSHNVDIELKTIDEGKCIVGKFEPIQDFSRSWQSMFQWMNENG